MFLLGEGGFTSRIYSLSVISSMTILSCGKAWPWGKTRSLGLMLHTKKELIGCGEKRVLWGWYYMQKKSWLGARVYHISFQPCCELQILCSPNPVAAVLAAGLLGKRRFSDESIFFCPLCNFVCHDLIGWQGSLSQWETTPTSRTAMKIRSTACFLALSLHGLVTKTTKQTSQTTFKCIIAPNIGSKHVAVTMWTKNTSCTAVCVPARENCSGSNPNDNNFQASDHHHCWGVTSLSHTSRGIIMTCAQLSLLFIIYHGGPIRGLHTGVLLTTKYTSIKYCPCCYFMHKFNGPNKTVYITDMHKQFRLG